MSSAPLNPLPILGPIAWRHDVSLQLSWALTGFWLLPLLTLVRGLSWDVTEQPLLLPHLPLLLPHLPLVLPHVSVILADLPFVLPHVAFLLAHVSVLLAHVAFLLSDISVVQPN